MLTLAVQRERKGHWNRDYCRLRRNKGPNHCTVQVVAALALTMESLVNSAKSHRPGVQRSQTAHADLSLPNRHHMFRTDTANTNAPKKHHRDFLHSHGHRHHDEKSAVMPTPTLLKPFAAFERSMTTSPGDSTVGSSESIPALSVSAPSIPPPARRGRKVRPAELAKERERGEERDE